VEFHEAPPARCLVDRDPRDVVEALYRDHGRRVLTICRALLRDHGEAEDAAQQVFLSAYRALLSGSIPRRPDAWLATIARNECRRRWGSRAVVPAEPVEDVTVVELPDAIVQRAEMAALWDAIAELPATQREALLLREVRGFSYDQLADTLGLSRPSIRSLLNRARRRLHTQVRTVSGAIAGMSWLEPLARLFTGGSDTVLSAATGVTAVGVGAVLLGGAAPAPHLARHALPSTPSPVVSTTPVTPSMPVPRPILPLTALPAHPQQRHAAAPQVRRAALDRAPAPPVPAAPAANTRAPEAPVGTDAAASSPATPQDDPSSGTPRGSHDGGRATGSASPTTEGPDGGGSGPTNGADDGGSSGPGPGSGSEDSGSSGEGPGETTGSGGSDVGGGEEGPGGGSSGGSSGDPSGGSSGPSGGSSGGHDSSGGHGGSSGEGGSGGDGGSGSDSGSGGDGKSGHG
jgi:RNA polymerase sigma factor (sigma-70 family)